MKENRLSLRVINKTLQQIETEREIALEDGDEASVKACDAVLLTWTKKQIKKVDAIGDAIKAYSSAANEIKAEGNRLLARAKMLEGIVERIKGSALWALQAFDVKSVESPRYKIWRQPNGGNQAVKITAPELIPDHCKLVTVTLPLDLYKKVVRLLPNETEEMRNMRASFIAFTNSQTMPSGTYIYNRLMAGEEVPGAHLEPRGEHVRIK